MVPNKIISNILLYCGCPDCLQTLIVAHHWTAMAFDPKNNRRFNMYILYNIY